MVERVRKIRIEELNPHLVCVLCGGYYIDATTIIECLHSFCKTCIVRYLETSKYCPICDVQVHKTKPLVSIRSDQTLQDLVYKLVPGLFTNEMRKRKEYYAKNKLPSPALAQSAQGEPAATPNGSEAAVTSSDQTSTADKGDDAAAPSGGLNGTDDEKISLSLEYSHDGRPVGEVQNGRDSQEVPSKRYLLCPAAFTIGHLKKFVRIKFNLELKYEIDVFHIEEPLSDQYTLMDIAYIYTWRRRGPLRLFYAIFEVPKDNRKRKLNTIPEITELTSPIRDDKAPSPAKVLKDTAKMTLPEKKKGLLTPVKVTSPAVATTNSKSPSSTTGTMLAQGSLMTSADKTKPQETTLTTTIQQQLVKQQQTVTTSTAPGQTFPAKPAEPPVKRKVGRPPKNGKSAAPKPPPKVKLQGVKRPPAPLLKLATSQAKLISSNAKSPITQSKTFHLVPRVTSPPPQPKTSNHDNLLVTSSSSVGATVPVTSSVTVVSEAVRSPSSAKPSQGSNATSTLTNSSTSTTSVLPTSKPAQPVKKPDTKPKCINTISNKLLASQQEAAAKVTEAQLSPSKPNISVHRHPTTSMKPLMSSQGTSPMSPVTTMTLSPVKQATSPLATTPNRPIKSCSSSTQTSTPPHSKTKPSTTSVSVATSPIDTKSPKSPAGGGKESPSSSSVKSTSTAVLPPTKLVPVKSVPASPNKKNVPASPNRNLFQEILGVKKPKVSDSTSQTTKSQLSPGKNKVSVATSPTGQSPVKRLVLHQEDLKTSPPLVGTKRDAATSSGGMSPPTPTTAHRPHIAVAVAPTPPKRPYLPVASGTAAGQISPPLRLKISSPGAGGTSLVKSPTSEQTHPTVVPQAHSNNKTSEVKDKKPSSTPESSAVEGRGPEQEVPLDLGTRKSVPVK